MQQHSLTLQCEVQAPPLQATASVAHWNWEWVGVAWGRASGHFADEQWGAMEKKRKKKKGNCKLPLPQMHTLTACPVF